LQLDLKGALRLGLFDVIFVFLFVDMFDTIGSLMGLGRQAGMLTSEGKLPKINRALFSDAAATTVGALLGTSTVTPYVESATGVTEGGRTGLTAIVVAVLFLLATFFSPLAGAVPAIATAPALIIVGVLMIHAAQEVNWADLTEGIPAFMTMIRHAAHFLDCKWAGAGFYSLSVDEGADRKVARKQARWCMCWPRSLFCGFAYLGAD
jgi:AGZA family xanthine/uracil permease-like MFS transporter